MPASLPFRPSSEGVSQSQPEFLEFSLLKQTGRREEGGDGKGAWGWLGYGLKNGGG